ncbi:MAG: hypothetical protein KA291_02455 [Psychrobacter sp.]|nr:hypothetical protein [Psychrobacter sp.]
MEKRPLIIEQKTVNKDNKPLRVIHNIEALRKKIGCATYDDLKPLGYDVDGYLSRKAEKRKEAADYDSVPTGYDSDGCYWGT